MNKSNILFEEKQYMGHNRLSILIRSIITLFCFIAYYWSENPKPVRLSFVSIGSYPIQNINNSGIIFFIIGICLLMFSTGLTYILHIQTKVYNEYMTLDGFWTARKVKIDLKNIISVRKSRYKKNVLRRAVYNLHNNGIIRFYTSGEEFIELIDNDGFTYRIGSQKALELYKTLKKQIYNKY